MIKFFRVYQNHYNIASYYNKWICNKEAGTADDMPDVEALPYSEEIIEITDKNFHSSDRVFIIRFSIEGDNIMLFARYTADRAGKDPMKIARNVMSDITKYICLNYKNEVGSGNLTRLLTHFLANYFKKFEDIEHKMRKIGNLKQGLINVQEMATQTFMTIVERGKTIGELQTEVETISHHGHVFHSKSRRLKHSIWAQRVKTYAITLVVFLVLILILYKLL